MRILNIINNEDEKFLRQKSHEVIIIDEEINILINKMKKTLLNSSGIGLSAPQIGKHLRIFIMSIPKNTEIQVFINPQIIWTSKNKTIYKEGCLSIPGIFLPVESFSEVKIQYRDQLGKEKTTHLRGLEAICAQHEIDHLNGILFIDRFKN